MTENNEPEAKKDTKSAIMEYLKAKKQPPDPDKNQRGKKNLSENKGFSSKRKSK